MLKQGVGRSIKLCHSRLGVRGRRTGVALRVQSARGFRRVLAGAVLVSIVFSGGCSTVIMADRGAEDRAGERSSAAERTALTSAADAVSQTRWPKPNANPLGAMLGGGRDRVSEQDAVETYLAALGGAGAGAVMADANRHLAAAGRLADTAAACANAARPVMADVAVVEDAIADLKGIRDVYVASLKSLKKEGERVGDDDIRAVRDDFNNAIRTLGKAADRLADSVAHNKSRAYAEPTVRRANFVGGR